MGTQYPVGFEMDYAVERSRVTTFFRLLLAIPHIIMLYAYTIALLVAWVVAWFALVITGRWPEGLYRFVSGYLRYAVRVSAYLYLGTDAYPPFSGAEDPTYPVRVPIAPPLGAYSRLKVFFRGIYGILAMVIRYAMGIVIAFVSLLSWFAIVFTGRQPQSLQNALHFALAYTTRADALLFLLTETYPPFGGGDGAVAPTVG